MSICFTIYFHIGPDELANLLLILWDNLLIKKKIKHKNVTKYVISECMF